MTRYLRPANNMPRIFLYRDPVDFRKQCNGLAAIAEQELGHNPFDGGLYAFTNRRRNKIKCLLWEDNGFVLYYKALAEEKFRWPRRGDEVISLTGQQINWLLDGYESLEVSKLLAALAEKDQLLEDKSQRLQSHQKHLSDNADIILAQEKRIRLLEECLRLATVQKFGASSEKLAFQADFFDEAEIEVALSELEEQLPEEDRVRPPKKKRKRGFSDKLQRVQIHLTLPDEEKAGAVKTFFTKVKEELEFIPAQVKVLEYWQEKAVFDKDGEDVIIAAQRPAHPLGKCFASTTLLAYIIASKYADGLPLYRLEGILKRYGGDISRSNMANWIVRLQDVFQPLINLIREVQLEGNYLQADETRLQVLKEAGKTAQSDKWMWVIRGGPPDR